MDNPLVIFPRREELLYLFFGYLFLMIDIVGLADHDRGQSLIAPPVGGHVHEDALPVDIADDKIPIHSEHQDDDDDNGRHDIPDARFRQELHVGDPSGRAVSVHNGIARTHDRTGYPAAESVQGPLRRPKGVRHPPPDIPHGRHRSSEGARDRRTHARDPVDQPAAEAVQVDPEAYHLICHPGQNPIQRSYRTSVFARDGPGTALNPVGESTVEMIEGSP